jgi:hypothetical protein
MIEVVIADHQDMFRTGIEEVLKVEDGLRMVGEAPCPEQLLNTLQKVSPHVLLLSKSFLPAVTRINPMLERNKTALLLLAEDNDTKTAWSICWRWRWRICEATGSCIDKEPRTRSPVCGLRPLVDTQQLLLPPHMTRMAAPHLLMADLLIYPTHLLP